jgi:hypothetical protein
MFCLKLFFHVCFHSKFFLSHLPRTLVGQMHITVYQKRPWRKSIFYIIFGVFITFKTIFWLIFLFTITMCCSFFIIYFLTLSMRILESNSNILYWKILYSNLCFWPSKKVFKCPLSFIMASLIRILIFILIIQLVIKYHYINNLITQDLWVHLGTK